jgi:hypothetical protein
MKYLMSIFTDSRLQTKSAPRSDKKPLNRRLTSARSSGITREFRFTPHTRSRKQQTMAEQEKYLRMHWTVVGDSLSATWELCKRPKESYNVTSLDNLSAF